MRTAVRVLAVTNAGLLLPTDDGTAASTLDQLDKVLSHGWHEDTPEVGNAISQVMQVDSLIAYQEKEFEMMDDENEVIDSSKVYKVTYTLNTLP